MSEPMEPVNDFFNLAPSPESLDQIVPNHRASDSPLATEEPEPKRSPLRERIRKATGSKPTVDSRDVRPGKPKKTVPNVPGQFVEPLTNAYGMLGFALMPFKPEAAMAILGPSRTPTPEDLENGVQIPTVAENCARCWDEVAQKNESIRRALDTFLTVGVWGALAAAHMPIVMALTGDRLNPAAAMEAMLKRQQEAENDGS